MEKTSVINAGYAFGRLTRAVQTATTHPDEAVRARAVAKVQAWQAVIEGMRSGSLKVGSRTPVADTPAWVTLEVAHGGFATGRYLAEGALQDHERELLASVPTGGPGETERERLNLWFVSDEGQDQLLDAVRSGQIRISVPEEGALPVAAWLMRHGFEAEALELLATLRPLMHRLRFYPQLTTIPRPPGALVRRWTVGEVQQRLRGRTPQRQVATMNETYAVWNPLYDRLVALWLTTVEGAIEDGGWPCRRWSSAWIDERERWLADYRAAADQHPLAGKHAHPKSNFAVLRSALEKCPADSAALSGLEVAKVRRALQGTVGRHGAPGSAEREALRAEQSHVGALPTHAEFDRVVLERLGEFPTEGGIPDLESVCAPAQGNAIPRSISKKVERALEAPIEELVERGVIGSAEVLAIVLPQITAQIAAASIEDASLAQLFTQIYAAFRRRRSLLLLDLAHQVRLEELPWIAALDPLRSTTLDTRQQARQGLTQITLLTLSSFPHTILPNPLVREMSALAKQAGLDVPLVEEVAADIFMGRFTPKWTRAAKIAVAHLHDTVYGRYYDLPKAIPAGDFADLCKQRAAEVGTNGNWVAMNGATLEQSQILTTHDLVVLVHELGLYEDVARMAPHLAARNLAWILQRQQQVAPAFKQRLHMLKNTAYAWRQAIFFLSMCDESAQMDVLRTLQDGLAEQPEPLQHRLRPVVAGLEYVLHGGRFDAQGRGSGGARRFLGWSVDPHWLMPG